MTSSTETKEQDRKYILLAKLPEYAKLAKELAGSIDKQDLLDDPLVHGGDPFEPDPHVTVLYGMPRLPSADCVAALESKPSLLTKAAAVNAFVTKDKKFTEGSVHSYDVLYVELDGKQELTNWRTLVADDTGTVPEYPLQPHMTIAFLKPGTSDRYVKQMTASLHVHESSHVSSLEVREVGKSDTVLMKISLGAASRKRKLCEDAASLKPRHGSPASESDMPASMDKEDQRMVLLMHKVVCGLSLWEEMKQAPPVGEGFLWWEADHLNKIRSHPLVKEDGLEGASAALVLRHIHYIAVHGWDEYVKWMNGQEE